MALWWAEKSARKKKKKILVKDHSDTPSVELAKEDADEAD